MRVPKGTLLQWRAYVNVQVSLSYKYGKGKYSYCRRSQGHRQADARLDVELLLLGRRPPAGGAYVAHWSRSTTASTNVHSR